ncbi:MAG TPA: PPE family protein, partial [Mycobacterium sp.]|nr:PPE family protein [Mycobacterium sp.]
IWNTIFASGFYMPARYAGTATNFLSMNQEAAKGASGAAEGVSAAAAGALDTPPGRVTLVDSVTASAGRGGLVGRLSVPQAWAAPAPPQTPLATPPGSTPVAAPSAPGTAGASSMPLPWHMGPRGEGRAMPQYGVRVGFVARPPAAG